MRSSKANSGRRGFVLPTAAVFFILAIPMIGLVIDLSTFYLVQSKLQLALDSASLAGTRALARGVSNLAQETAAINTATAYVHANFPDGYMGATLNIPTPVVDTSVANRRSVRVTADVSVPQMFLRWFGGNFSTVNAVSKAIRRDVNVAIVMDRSGSLQNSGACAPLKAAAQAFTDKFAEGRDNMTLVTFATASRADFPIASNFKTATPSVPQIIGSVDCNGWTNSAQGLWMGYEQLASLNQPAALNVILFFTDGKPTAFTADFPNTCGDGATRRGVLSERPSGLFEPLAPVQPASDGVTLGNSAACQYNNNVNSVQADIGVIPLLDRWGNNLNSGYQNVNLSGGGINPSSAGNASINAAENAAFRIRTGAATTSGAPALPGVVIFGIALYGTGAPSADFMLRVTNDPNSPIYTTSQAEGLYVPAPTSADLKTAFEKVASEILRIAE